MKSWIVETLQGRQEVDADDWSTSEGMLFLHANDKVVVAIFAPGKWVSCTVKN